LQSSRLVTGPTAQACENSIGPVRISLAGQYNLLKKISKRWCGPVGKKVDREDCD